MRYRPAVRGVTALLLSLSLFASTNAALAQAGAKRQLTPAEAMQGLQDAQAIDLTHDFGPDSPHWKGFPPQTTRNIYSMERDGFRADIYSIVGQWGTHVDAPAHFHAGGATIDTIPIAQMMMPLVVIDIHAKVAADPDYVVSMADVRAWEARHGAIPKGAFVALRTDWSKRWPDDAAMQNRDAHGVAHYPGWSKPVLRYLYEDRGITASGHETTDTDPGVAVTKDDYSLESYILGLGHYQVELLANLDRVPDSGAVVLVTFPKARDATGFPARVIAFAPRHGPARPSYDDPVAPGSPIPAIDR